MNFKQSLEIQLEENFLNIQRASGDGWVSAHFCLFVILEQDLLIYTFHAAHFDLLI